MLKPIISSAVPWDQLKNNSYFYLYVNGFKQRNEKIRNLIHIFQMIMDNQVFF